MKAPNTTTVAILPIYDANGEKSYRATAGDKHSVGKTAGQALDALTGQLGESEFSALLLLQSFYHEQFFNVEQQQRLSKLMDLWRQARDAGQSLSKELQAGNFSLSPPPESPSNGCSIQAMRRK